MENTIADSVSTRLRIANIKAIDHTVFETGSFIGKGTPTINYRLLKPELKNTKKHPLIIVFHGSGAVGKDNLAQLGILAKLWAMPEIKSKYPAYILAPQFPTRSSNYVEDKQRGVLTSVPQPCLETALQLIDSLKTSLNIDVTRIYALGFSMGGSSVTNVLSARPDLFAAGVSISGIPQFDKVKTLSNIPLWLMHGNLDTENPFASDAQFYKEAGSKTRFWEIDGKAHNDIFSSLILGEAIPKWLLQHKKP
ncbi:MAG: prolyl oligopeptidase family serine peptidase, partial [Bacteroidia bacterium]